MIENHLITTGDVYKETTDLKGAIEQLDGTLITDTASGVVTSFLDGADDVPVRNLIVHGEPVQDGSGDPSPENERPISGWTGVNLFKTAGNLINPADYVVRSGYGDHPVVTESNGVLTFSSITSGGRFVTFLFPVEVGATYSFKADAVSNASVISTLKYTFFDTRPANYHYAGESNYGLLQGATVIATAPWLGIMIGVSIGTTSLTVTNLRCIKGSTMLPFTPYGKQTAITFPTEAGTVYGFTLDVTNGVLTVDRASVTLSQCTYVSDFTSGNRNTGALFKTPSTLPDPDTSNTDNKVTICNRAVQNSASAYFCNNISSYANSENRDYNSVATKADGRRLGIVLNVTGYESLEAFLADYGDTQVIYYLYRPQTYQLPETIIKTLKGLNNIWADCGNTDVEYVADTKLYIQKLTQPTEDDMVANANIASGVFFMVGNNLFLSSAAIAQGAAIVPGTNCTQLSLADALNTLNS